MIKDFPMLFSTKNLMTCDKNPLKYSLHIPTDPIIFLKDSKTGERVKKEKQFVKLRSFNGLKTIPASKLLSFIKIKKSVRI